MAYIYVVQVKNGNLYSVTQMLRTNNSRLEDVRLTVNSDDYFNAKKVYFPLNQKGLEIDGDGNLTEIPHLESSQVNGDLDDDYENSIYYIWVVVSEHANEKEFIQSLSPDVKPKVVKKAVDDNEFHSKRAGKHFIPKDFVTAPGPWVFVALLLIGAGILWPVAAPALVATAVATLGLAAISLVGFAVPRYVDKLNKKYSDGVADAKKMSFLKKNFLHFKEWLCGDPDKHKPGHGWQAFVALIGLGLVITVAVFVAGFFTGGGAFAVVGGVMIATGGGGFAFMGPALAAIAGVLGTAAVAAGAEISLVAVTTATLMLAALNITDVVREILAFFDGFDNKYRKDEVLVPAVKVPDNDEKVVDDTTDEEDNLVIQTEKPNLLDNAAAYVSAVFTNMKDEFPLSRPKPVEEKENDDKIDLFFK